MPISLPGAVIADANVLIAAVIRGRAKLVLASGRIVVHATTVVHVEVERYAPIVGARRRIDENELLRARLGLPVLWHWRDAYAEFESEARSRMAERDPDDWPTVALALALGLPIWTQDKDFSVAGIPTYTTGELLDALREAGKL